MNKLRGTQNPRLLDQIPSDEASPTFSSSAAKLNDVESEFTSLAAKLSRSSAFPNNLINFQRLFLTVRRAATEELLHHNFEVELYHHHQVSVGLEISPTPPLLQTEYKRTMLSATSAPPHPEMMR